VYASLVSMSMCIRASSVLGDDDGDVCVINYVNRECVASSHSSSRYNRLCETRIVLLSTLINLPLYLIINITRQKSKSLCFD
jgi:hypothetical protein